MDLPFDPVILLLEIYPKAANSNLNEHKHSFVHCNAIYSHQDMEAVQVSLSRVDKTTMGHLHNEILLSYKKEENFTICDSMDGPGEHYAE